MKMTKMLAAVALAASCVPALADYPDKAITLIVPYPAGGSTDALARPLAIALGKVLKQAVVIDNASGAGGTIGTAKLARSPNDGYWMVLNNIGMATSPALYRTLPYKNEDLVPVGLVATTPSVLIARKDLPANNLAELLAYIKANPAKVNMGHSGVGSASQLCGLLYQKEIKQRVTAVPYKGAAPAMTDIMSGMFDFMCEQSSVVLPFADGGKVKMLAVTTKDRVAQLPNVPTTAESGLPSLTLGVWHGIYVPKGTPTTIINKLSDALAVALRDADVQKRYADLGAKVATGADIKPEALAKLQQSETERWTPIIKANGEYAD